MRNLTTLLLLIGLSGFANIALAMSEVVLTIKDHKFSPETITIPAGKKIKLIVKNLDATPEEFESYVLHREKIIQPKGKVKIFIGPLKPGRYPFFGEFHADTAKGVIVAE